MNGGSRLTVFAQRAHAELDVASLRAHAARFFATHLVALEPSEDGRSRVSLSSPRLGLEGAVVTCRSEAASGDDYRRADDAEARSRAGGMGALARRCKSVVRLDADDARATLLFAAILATVELGPILEATENEGGAIFGVKTARERLERQA